MQPVDGICADFRNEEKLRDECRRARMEGFTGKLAIHPSQVPVINEMFTPSQEEVAFARRVVEAFDNANGAGTVGLDGRMLDLPHLKQAKRVLQLADT
jgi:citrate lyase subunit beta/citryl-CoA lyase